jgi:UDP-2,3-diacylglucosamine hydrolase
MPGIFFVSDIHLGLQGSDEERIKLDNLERLFAIIKAEGRSLYLLGDILDYWMEYRHVIPKGFTRFLCLMSDLVHHGIEVNYFAGNHDFHLGRYFDDELGVRTRYGMHEVRIDGKLFMLAHGDGLGEGDLGYKLFARFIRNRFNLGLLTGFHPDLATALMRRFSRLSRDHKPGNRQVESNRLLHFAGSLARDKVFDYFVCGHNHAQKMQVVHESGSCYVNLGSWIEGHYPYGVFDQGLFQIREL